MTSISWALMFYNEEESIRDALDSFSPFVTEVVAIDMGSQDNSRNIVSEYTNKIYESSLNNNFAAARNFAISKCETDWIFIADPDEWLLEKDRDKFKQAIDSIDSGGKEAYQMIRYNWMDADMTKQYNVSGTNDRQIRIMKNLPRIRYVFPVHEIVQGYKSAGTIEGFGLHHGHFKVKKERRDHMSQLYDFFSKMKR